MGPLTSGLGGEAKCSWGLEQHQQAAEHKAGARGGPHGPGGSDSQHSCGARGILVLSTQLPSQEAPH